MEMKLKLKIQLNKGHKKLIELTHQTRDPSHGMRIVL
jgi:hypothetical protein